MRNLLDWLRSPAVLNVLWSLVIIAAAGIVAALVRVILGPIIRRFTARTRTNLDDLIVRALNRPIGWGILLLGIYLAVLRARRWEESQANAIEKAVVAAAIVLAIYAALRTFNAVAGWYTETAAERSPRVREVRVQAVIGRKLISLLILVGGVLILLDQLGVEITTLVAGLGLGGLAVALALQDTLANLFAGVYMMVDRPISVGDFVKLESGEEGFVEEIGWRNTKVRMWANNIVVIPNSKLAQSVVTNYYLPQQEMSVYVGCGVAYESDLEHVERVCIEVGEEVMARVPGCAPDWTPVVRFKEFADFSINFIVVLRVRDFDAQYALAHEYIKALHRRFGEEGIEIPFPIRTVVMRPPEARSPRPPREAGGTTPGSEEVGDGDAGNGADC